MLKIVLTFSLLLGVLTFSACSDDKEDSPTTPAATTPTPEPDISYTQGFYGLEKDGQRSWRWMGDQGVVKLKNTGKDMTLRIIGDVPLAELKVAPTFKISLNGVILEEFTAKAVDKEYQIPAAKQSGQPASELSIVVSNYFIPKQVYAKSEDERKLSLSLKQLSWEPK